MKQQQQSYLVGSPSEQQQNIKRRRVHGELTSNNDFYSRFYNSSSSPTKTQGIRIDPPWLKNNNMYHNAMQQQSHSNSYVSSLSSSSSSSYLVGSWDNHGITQTSTQSNSLGSSPMQHSTPPNLIGGIGIHALQNGNNHLITTAPQFTGRIANTNTSQMLQFGGIGSTNNSSFQLTGSPRASKIDGDSPMVLQNETDASPSVNTTHCNAMTPGYMMSVEKRNNVFFNSANNSRINNIEGKKVNSKLNSRSSMLTAPSPCAPLREGITQMELQ